MLLQAQCSVSHYLILPPNLIDLPLLNSLHSACSLETAFQLLMGSDSLTETLSDLLQEYWGCLCAARHFEVYKSEESDLCSENDAFNTLHCSKVNNSLSVMLSELCHKL